MNKPKPKLGIFSGARLVALVITLAIVAFVTATAFMKGNARYSKTDSILSRKASPAVPRSLFLDPQEQEARLTARGPVEGQLRRAQQADADLRDQPYRKPTTKWRPERYKPE